MSELNTIFQGVVINNQDPLMLGRIRAVPITETESALLPKNWDPVKDIWTKKDPLIFLPLLPYYLSQVPIVDEYIHIFYYNTSQVVDNTKFYIQGPITRPQNNFFEDWHNSESMLSTGPFIKTANYIKDPISFEIKGEAKGIYPQPGDNSVLGRGTSDVVVKEDEVLIRAGKNIRTQITGYNIPTPRQNRAFLQVSSFSQEKDELDPKNKKIFKKKSLLVKKLIEWEITNEIFISGNTVGGGVTGTTFYNGKVSLYSLLPKSEVRSILVNMNTPLDAFKSGPEFDITFTGKTKFESISIINQFITGVNNGKIKIQGYPQFPFENDTKLDNQFPFYFRPTKNNILYLASSGSSQFNMVNNVFKNIKLLPSNKEVGSALVWSKNVVGEQLSEEDVKLKQPIYKPNPVSYGALASDFIYLLSHKSEIPEKQKINLFPKETLYGIDQEFFVNKILPSTEPMVRGNELMKLLDLIVKFLGSHVHNINESPIPIGTDGSNIEEIRALINNANNSILNQNIRIN